MSESRPDEPRASRAELTAIVVNLVTRMDALEHALRSKSDVQCVQDALTRTISGVKDYTDEALGSVVDSLEVKLDAVQRTVHRSITQAKTSSSTPRPEELDVVSQRVDALEARLSASMVAVDSTIAQLSTAVECVLALYQKGATMCHKCGAKAPFPGRQPASSRSPAASVLRAPRARSTEEELVGNFARDGTGTCEASPVSSRMGFPRRPEAGRSPTPPDPPVSSMPPSQRESPNTSRESATLQHSARSRAERTSPPRSDRPSTTAVHHSPARPSAVGAVRSPAGPPAPSPVRMAPRDTSARRPASPPAPDRTRSTTDQRLAERRLAAGGEVASNTASGDTSSVLEAVLTRMQYLEQAVGAAVASCDATAALSAEVASYRAASAAEHSRNTLETSTILNGLGRPSRNVSLMQPVDSASAVSVVPTPLRQIARPFGSVVDTVGALLAAASPADPLIVAIAGLPGSGKSTCAVQLRVALEQRLGVQAVVVPQDGFHLYRRELDTLPDPAAAHRFRGASFTFAPTRLHRVLEAIRYGHAVAAPEFDHSLGDPVEDSIFIPSDVSVVIVEGLYLLSDSPPWDTLQKFWDLKLFINRPWQDAGNPTQSSRARLVARHQAAWGWTEAQASARADDSDRRNVAEISRSKAFADMLVQPDTWPFPTSEE